MDSETMHYIVLEMIEGESLAARIARAPLSLDEVLLFGKQIASALDAAHRRGIVHRDLKPGNVMITKAGAKLPDFGLAKAGLIAAIVSVQPPPISSVQSMSPPALDYVIGKCEEPTAEVRL